MAGAAYLINPGDYFGDHAHSPVERMFRTMEGIDKVLKASEPAIQTCKLVASAAGASQKTFDALEGADKAAHTVRDITFMFAAVNGVLRHLVRAVVNLINLIMNLNNNYPVPLKHGVAQAVTMIDLNGDEQTVLIGTHIPGLARKQEIATVTTADGPQTGVLQNIQTNVLNPAGAVIGVIAKTPKYHEEAIEPEEKVAAAGSQLGLAISGAATVGACTSKILNNLKNYCHVKLSPAGLKLASWFSNFMLGMHAGGVIHHACEWRFQKCAYDRVLRAPPPVGGLAAIHAEYRKKRWQHGVGLTTKSLELGNSILKKTPVRSNIYVMLPTAWIICGLSIYQVFSKSQTPF